MSQPPEDYAKRPSLSSDQDLSRLSADVESLVPEAREALRLELERRNIPVESIDWTAQPVIQAAPSDGAAGFGRFVRNLVIFAACDLGYIVVAGVIVAKVNGTDVEKFTASLTDFLIHLSFGLAIVTANPILIPRRFVPQTTKTLFIVGAAAPPIAFLLIITLWLLHLTDAVSGLFWPDVVIWLFYGWWRDKRKRPQATLP
jgi:hypothetical protein